MADSWFLLNDSPRSRWESEVVEGLRRSADRLTQWGVRPEQTQTWQHTRTDGSDWLLAHIDLARDGVIVKTLRVDLDSAGFRGGWSPACLNWDASVAAEDAEIDLSPPEGIERKVSSDQPMALGTAAADWMIAIVERWSRER